MTDHKFTDEEVIKALKHCASETSSKACVGCPFDENGACIDSENAMVIYALSLINRQKEEINRLEKGELREAMTFNSTTIKRCVASAIKEFAERLKAEMRNLARLQDGDATYYIVGEPVIDDLVKEMTEEHTHEMQSTNQP